LEFVTQALIERFDRLSKVKAADFVINESRIGFYLNGEKLLSVMSVPSDQDAHIAGFLLSEGVIENPSAIKSIRVSDDGLSVYIDANVDESARKNLFKEKTLTSGCCVGVTGNVEDKIAREFLAADYKVAIGVLLDAAQLFAQKTPLFEQTGCVHRAALVLESGETFSAEDIGRHNAIDKAIGRARLNGLDVSRSFLMTTGRLSMEMTMKCVMHRVPIVISKAAVTLQGIRSALEYGVTLGGFARNGRINFYAHSGRIIV
jgi:FdhD protein